MPTQYPIDVDDRTNLEFSFINSPEHAYFTWKNTGISNPPFATRLYWWFVGGGAEWFIKLMRQLSPR